MPATASPQKKKLLKKRIKASPSTGAPKETVLYGKALNLAIRIFKRAEIYNAIYLLEQLVSQIDQDIEPKTLLLDCYSRAGRYDLAAPLANKILSSHADNPNAYSSTALFFRSSGNGEKSAEILLKGSEKFPKEAELYSLQGDTYSSLGLPDQAIDAYNLALALSPNNSANIYNKFRILKAKSSDHDKKNLLDIIENKKTNNLVDHGLYQLAAAWSNNGTDTQTQIKHLKKGNQLLAEAYPSSQDINQQEQKDICHFFDQELTDQLSTWGNPKPEPIFIASMPRSGTTLLEQIIGSHPKTKAIGESLIVGSAIDDVAQKTNNAHKFFWQWAEGKEYGRYIAMLNASFQPLLKARGALDLAIIDKSLDNYKKAGLILLLFPNAKIIHLQRHPLDVILSNHQLYITHFNNSPWSIEDQAIYYQIHLNYMEHWKKIFPGKILSINYEDIVSNQEQSTRKIIDFCRLDWDERCLNFYNSNEAINSPSSMQVRQPINNNAIERWKPFAEYLKPAAEILNIQI